MKSKLNNIFRILPIIAIMACTNTKPEPLTKYPDWIVVQKPYGNPVIDNYIRYSLEIQKGDTVKKVWTYQYYYESYNIGDTIRNR